MHFLPPNYVFLDDFPPGSVVIDAGCGSEAELSRHLMSQRHVRAFGVDPTKKHAPALRALEHESGGLFTHVPVAIAAADGTLTFNESVERESGSIYATHGNIRRFPSRSYEVEALSLRGLLRRIGVDRVQLLKLDLEGAEYDLLGGIEREALEPFRQVFVEFHPSVVPDSHAADTAARVSRVESMGFLTFTLDDINYLFYRP